MFFYQLKTVPQHFAPVVGVTKSPGQPLLKGSCSKREVIKAKGLNKNLNDAGDLLGKLPFLFNCHLVPDSEFFIAKQFPCKMYKSYKFQEE